MQEDKDQKPLKINISVENFGPIEKADIDLRPLTVFVGESNTGKTYLAALIYALHKDFDGFTQFPWSFETRSMISFTFRRVARNISIQEELEKEIYETLEKLNAPDRPFKFSDLPIRISSQLESNLNRTDSIEEKLRLYFDLESIPEIIRSVRKSRKILNISLNISNVNQCLWSFDMNNSGAESSVNGSINGDMVIQIDCNAKNQETVGAEEFARFFHVDMRDKNSSYFLPAARSGIMQSHGILSIALNTRTTRVGLEKFPEIPTFTGLIVDFLHQVIQYNESRKSLDAMNSIANYLEDEVLHGKIEVNKPAGFGYPEYLYQPKHTEQSFRMSQSSSMVTELAPLVLYLRGYVKPGDTLIIEEPESHLHPRAQTQIAITLARLVRAGVRVIITTHSDWLLEQIGNIVREGEVMKLEITDVEQPTTWLTREEVGAWRFHSDQPVEEIKFDAIAGFEPPDYGAVAEALYNRSVDLRTWLMEDSGDDLSE